jgi:hypothetical protein
MSSITEVTDSLKPICQLSAANNVLGEIKSTKDK